ncbi:hypothetical protein Q5M85_13975 [Paraclostridium bifermentans]|nr:hypothetical protein [Paraclostridium bifermentans]
MKNKKHNDLSIYDLKECKKSLEEKYLYKYDIVEVKALYKQKRSFKMIFIIVRYPGLNQNLLKIPKNEWLIIIKEQMV